MPSKKSAKAAAAETATEAPPASNGKTSPPTDKKHRRSSHSATHNAEIYKPEELKVFLGEDKTLELAKEVSKLNWKMNTNPASLDDVKRLKEIPISSPKIKKLNIFFGTGMHVTARAGLSSPHGVTVYDVLSAIYKQYKKKADDELEDPVLADILWGRGEDMVNASPEWPAVILVKQKKEAPVQGKKKKDS